MAQTKPDDDLKHEALTVLKQWRGADREAVAAKGDNDKQTTEYKYRKSLRKAADNLTAAHHG